MEKQFIIWDRIKDGEPVRDTDGNINSNGIIGRVGMENVYFTAYARWPDDCRTLGSPLEKLGGSHSRCSLESQW